MHAQYQQLKTTIAEKAPKSPNEALVAVDWNRWATRALATRRAARILVFADACVSEENMVVRL